MQTKENLSQTVKDVKVEIIKDVFKKENTANAEELLDAIEEGVRKFVRTTLEVCPAPRDTVRFVNTYISLHIP